MNVEGRKCQEHIFETRKTEGITKNKSVPFYS